MSYEIARPIACVIGAAGDIGRRLILPLIEAGYYVVASCRHPVARLASLRERYAPHTLDVLELDVLLPAPLMTDRVAAHFARFDGRCALLVIAHGTAPRIGPFSALTDDLLREVIETDVLGTLRVCQAFYPLLRRQAPTSVALLSSIHALGCYPQRVPYATAKAAVCGMARALAVEWAHDGIQVNALAPGQVYGARTAAIASRLTTTETDVLRLMHERSPAGRLVDCEDLATTVLWLARTPSITGQTIVLDYGVSVSNWYEPFAVKDAYRG